MVEVVAHLSSNLNASEDRFTIQSKLREPSKYMLSGISGGPVFAFQSKGRIVPIGIVFEGHPSGEADGDDRPLGFLTENDIMVRGLVLTPEKFAYWLTAI